MRVSSPGSTGWPAAFTANVNDIRYSFDPGPNTERVTVHVSHWNTGSGEPSTTTSPADSSAAEHLGQW